MYEVRVSLRQEKAGRWRASAEDPPVSVMADDRETALRRLRDAVLARRPGPDRELVLVVETVPVLLGVAETANVLGWDKRRVITYVDRGGFPEPLVSLAGGRVWALDDVLAFREAFRARRRARRRRR